MSYERFFGIDGRWDYFTEENTEAPSASCRLLRRVVTLRNEVRRFV
jgi:hypothetical protein